jgi:hypothetical protein
MPKSHGYAILTTTENGQQFFEAEDSETLLFEVYAQAKDYIDMNNAIIRANGCTNSDVSVVVELVESSETT